MTQCDETPSGDGGTGEQPLFPRTEIKSEEEGKKGLNTRRYETGSLPVPPSPSGGGADLARFLAENPAMSVRDWKGKGFHAFAPFDRHYVAPRETPWDKLDRDEVRRLAITTKARFLSRNERMAAARDPGLIWDERSRSYRLKPGTPPPPPLAIEQAAEMGGAHESYPPTRRRPAAARNETANMGFRPGEASGALARGRSRGRARGEDA